MFFHYLMAGESDPYVLALHLRFDHHKRLDGVCRGDAGGG